MLEQLSLRPVGTADQEAVWRLGAHAFGYLDRQMPDGWSSDTPGRHTWGVFDAAGELIARAVDREQGHWFGGRVVAASGVAGVAVAPEWRGRGVAKKMLARLLEVARERGAVISTLFNTTPFAYRHLGWEEVGVQCERTMPASALSMLKSPQGNVLRPATVDDVPALHDLYDQVAQASSGMMHRRGPLFDQSPERYLAGNDGVTVALGAHGRVEGYVRWDRGLGYGEDGVLAVDDLFAVSPAAADALLAMLGGWASVTPTIKFRLGDTDVVRFASSWATLAECARRPWMLRVVDLAGAIAARGWPVHVSGSVVFDVVDQPCPWNTGRFTLSLDGGTANLDRHAGAPPAGADETTALRWQPRGLSLWYAGAASPALLRHAGLLSGGDLRTDAFLSAATAGPTPSLLDYF